MNFLQICWFILKFRKEVSLLALKYDGVIRIQTAVDSDGFDKGLKKMESALHQYTAGAADELDKIGQSAENSKQFAANLLVTLKKAGKVLSHIKLNTVDFGKFFRNAGKAGDLLIANLSRLGCWLKQTLNFKAVGQSVAMIRREMKSFLAVNQDFIDALAQIKGVLLTAFQPVYEIAAPAVISLLNLLSRAIAVVSQFTAVLFGSTAKKAQKNAENLYQQARAVDAVGNSAKKAAKNAELAVAAFDEFNILRFPDNYTGGGSTKDLDLPDFNYDYDDFDFDSWGEAFSAFLDKLLDGIPKLENTFLKFADWLNDFAEKLYDMFKFPGVLDKIKSLGSNLAGALNKLVNWIDWNALGRALGAGLNLALNFLTSFLYAFDWLNLGRKLADFINGLVSEIDWFEFGRLLWAGFKIALETLAGFIVGLDMPLMARAVSDVVLGFFEEMKNSLQKIPWFKIGEQLATFLNNIDWYTCFSCVIRALQAALRAVQQTIAGFVDTLKWSEIAENIYSAINDSFGNLNWRQMGRTLGDLFIQAVQFLRDMIAGIDWFQIGADVGNFIVGIDWVGALGGVAGAIAAGLNAAIKSVRGFLDAVVPDLREIAHGIAEKINQFFQDVDWENAGRVISDGLIAALDFALEFMKNVDWNAIGQAIVKLLENIDWAGLLSRWGELMGEIMTAKLALMNMDGIVLVGKNIVDGLLKGMLEKMASIGAWLKEFVADPVINGVKNLFGIHSPSTVFAEIGRNVVAGFLSGISEKWRGVTDFFNQKISELKNKDWASIGKSIVDGVLKGLQSIFGRLSGWASNVWNSITGAFSNSKAKASVSSAAAYSPASVAAEYETFRLPKLANGAVIPPNQQFAAILGDQKSGMNIEAPLATIKKAFQDVLSTGNYCGDIVINLTNELDGQILTRKVIRVANDMTRAAGKPVLLF